MDLFDRLVDAAAGRMRIDEQPVPAPASEQVPHGVSSSFPLMSHSAMSTAAMAAMVTGPRRQ